MKQLFFYGILSLCLGSGSLTGGIVSEENKPPRIRNTTTEQYQRNGGVWLFNHASSRIAEISLSEKEKEFMPGRYFLYLKLAGVKKNSQLELELGGDLKSVLPVNTGGLYVGPFVFKAEKPFSVLRAKGQNVKINSLFLADSPVPEIKTAGMPQIKQDHCIWFEWQEKYPYWFRKKSPLRLDFRSIGVGTAKLTAEIHDYAHKMVKEKKFEFNLGKSGTLELPEPDAYGPYILRLNLVLPDGKKVERQMAFSVVSPPLSKPSPHFGGHGNSPLIAAMGGGIERLWDTNNSLLWSQIEKEKGKITWGTLPPEPLKALVVLDEKRVPKWAPDTFEDPSGFYRYVDLVSKHYKGKVAVYEIFNESYRRLINPGPEKFREIVERTVSIIRKNDPQVSIAVGGPPEEMPPGLDAWEQMAKHGIFNSTNAVSGHFYVGAGGTHPLDQDVRFDAYISAVKNLLKRCGHGSKPLFNTEAGICPMETFYMGQERVYGLWGTKGFTERAPVPYPVGTAMYARLFLLNRFHDVIWTIYHTKNSYGSSWSLADADYTPLPGAVGITQAARLLEGYLPHKKLQLPKGLMGIEFKKGNGVVAAFWGVSLQRGETRFVSGPLPGEVRILDMFCNVLPKSRRYEAGMHPLYVTGPEKSVDSFFRGLKTDSVFAKQKPSDLKRIDVNLCRKGYNGFRIIAPETAEGYSLNYLYDGVTVSSGAKEECWMPSDSGHKKFSITYEWSVPQKINWITAAWAMGYHPETYQVEWWNGSRWIYAQGTWRGMRKTKENTESYPVTEFKTTKLRLSFLQKKEVPVRMTEFCAFHAPRLTPPVSEMQEVYNLDFEPGSGGFLGDWLICGPFPANGNRYTKKTPPLWDEMFLKNHYHYGRQYNDATIRPKVDFKHFVEFRENLNTNWFVGKGTVHWFPYHSKDGFVDFAKAFYGTPVHAKPQIIENCYGYAVCYITLKNRFEGQLAIGSDDGYKVMIGDKTVAQKIIYRGAGKDQEKYPVAIPSGTHRILVRVHNDINGHGFWFRLLEKDGKPFTDYSIKIVP